MTPFSAGSADSARPGRPSVTRLIHRMWIGKSGIGRPKKGASKMAQISPELPVIDVFDELADVVEYSATLALTDLTMVAKLSSRRIM
jgi:hypothetical protein